MAPHTLTAALQLKVWGSGRLRKLFEAKDLINSGHGRLVRYYLAILKLVLIRLYETRQNGEGGATSCNGGAGAVP